MSVVASVELVSQSEKVLQQQHVAETGGPKRTRDDVRFQIPDLDLLNCLALHKFVAIVKCGSRFGAFMGYLQSRRLTSVELS